MNADKIGCKRIRPHYKDSRISKNNFSYICEETLALELNYKEEGFNKGSKIHLIENLKVNVVLEKR